MNEYPVKQYPTIGCCGIDCGLCPRYYTIGNSKCPGCAGPDFYNKHPSCGYITCCVKKKGLEVCGQCNEFPCSRFESWLDKENTDSFVTHRKCKTNLEFIREKGIGEFIEQQKKRIELLEEMLKDFDDSRSKSFYCQATTLLSINDLDESLQYVKGKIEQSKIERKDVKSKAKVLRETLQKVADNTKIDLKLKKT